MDEALRLISLAYSEKNKIMYQLMKEKDREPTTKNLVTYYRALDEHYKIQKILIELAQLVEVKEKDSVKPWFSLL